MHEVRNLDCYRLFDFMPMTSYNFYLIFNVFEYIEIDIQFFKLNACSYIMRETFKDAINIVLK